MAYIDVKRLAELAGVSATRLLVQMKAAGLPQTKAVDMVSEEEKETLLSFLRNKTSDASDGRSRLSLRRKSVSTLRVGRGSTSGKTVNVEVRKKRAKPVLSYRKPADTNEDHRPIHTPTEPTPNHPDADKAHASDTSATDPDLTTDQSNKTHSETVDTETKTTQQKEPIKTGINQAESPPNPVDNRQHSDAKKDSDNQKHSVQNSDSQKGNLQKENKGNNKKGHTPSAQGNIAKKTGANKTNTNLVGDAETEGKVKTKKSSPKKAILGEKAAPKLNIIKHIDLNADLDDVEILQTEAFVARKSRKRLNKPFSLDNKHAFNKPVEQSKKEIQLTGPISVADLAHELSCKAAALIKHLMKAGHIVTINHLLDIETAIVLVEDLGHKAVITEDKSLEEQILNQVGQPHGDSTRPPVVAVMGHVDHGKTSLLDYIRRTKVASGEAGGITQHIGAYQVETRHGKITFIDTPGHAAFTKMRARGADATDIVILVVAGDDSVMPQTEEAIQHAQAAEVPIIVAINKIDKPEADPEKIKNELANKNVISEDWGGEVQFVQVSAHSGQGIESLLEAISLQAEILDLKAAGKGPANGVVIESKVDKKRGVLSTVLVQAGTLKHGDLIVAGLNYGRVRALADEHAHKLGQAAPSKPVEILGLDGAPDVGEKFYVVTTEKQARNLVDHRKQQVKFQEVLKSGDKLANLFSTNGESKTLNLVIKADVRGSLEAIRGVLLDLNNDEVQVKIISSGIGGINESDVNLAKTSAAMILGFNVRADAQAKVLMESESTELRYYSIIYDLVDDVKKALEGMLSPELREKILGVAEVRDVFNSSKFGQVAGCMVVEGTLDRNKKIRVLRDNVVIFEGELESLRRFKDDVQQVRNGMECGIGVKNYNDVRAGDKIEVFDTVEVLRKL